MPTFIETIAFIKQPFFTSIVCFVVTFILLLVFIDLDQRG